MHRVNHEALQIAVFKHPLALVVFREETPESLTMTF